MGSPHDSTATFAAKIRENSSATGRSTMKRFAAMQL